MQVCVLLGVLLVGILQGCGGPRARSAAIPAPVPRRSVVWLGPEGLDGDTAARLREVGVDEVVIRRGTVDLSGSQPSLRCLPLPPLTQGLPVGLALAVTTGSTAPPPEHASTVWNALAATQSSLVPVELLLDMPSIPEGMDVFVSELATVAGIPVLPVLTPDQIGEESIRRLVEAARGAVVLAYGQVGLIRKDAMLSAEPLERQLASLASSGARVRIGIVLTPRTSPALGAWGDDINPLTEGQVATFTTATAFDRVFKFQEQTSWSGRSWGNGDTLAVRRMDIPRLDQSLREACRMTLPELGGWDLITLPPPTGDLGMSREALLRYLAGDGPEPRLRVDARRQGRAVTVSFENTSLFSSVVSSFSNWVEISCDIGYIVANEPGSFDQVMHGTRRGDSWEAAERSNVNSVRFVERYVAPEESASSGELTLSNARAKTTLHWHVVLSNGAALEGSRPIS